MEVGLGVLGIAPAAFWTMTLKELAAAVRGRFGPAPPAPLKRSDLEAMMQRFPDAAQPSRVGPAPV
jgi:uncharacterized phage protein (TIGR02216 family)